jgi:hypothetical protein
MGKLDKKSKRWKLVKGYSVKGVINKEPFPKLDRR